MGIILIRGLLELRLLPSLASSSPKMLGLVVGVMGGCFARGVGRPVTSRIDVDP